MRLDQLERSHSRSWFGDHSDTYFGAFETPPGGRSFDIEWGFASGFGSKRNSGWHSYAREEVKDYVLNGLGEDIFFAWHELEQQISTSFATARDQTLDAIEGLETKCDAKSLVRYRAKIENELTPYTAITYVNAQIKSVPRMTRDLEEFAKGQSVPLHVQYQSSFEVCRETNGNHVGSCHDHSQRDRGRHTIYPYDFGARYGHPPIYRPWRLPAVARTPRFCSRSTGTIFRTSLIAYP